MAKPDLFDEIIDLLKREAEFANFAEVSPEVLNDFYTDSNTTKKTEPNIPEKINQPQQHNPPPQQQPQPQPEPGKPVGNLDIRELFQVVNSCTTCPLHQGRTNVVFGEGNPDADLMFIGEGPGRDEDEQGRPFVGRAGMLLTKMINAMQFDRQEVFIANIVKCRPPGNRNPEDQEAEKCLPYLYRQIELIKPKVLVLLGAVPLKYLLNKTGITRIHGQWQNLKGIQTMPTFHPAYLLRNPPAKKDAWEDLKKVMKVLGKTPPPPKKK